MTKNGPVEAVLDRLTSAEWDGENCFNSTLSRARLLREYLRRAARWAQILDATSEWPLFDIAGHIDPTTDVPPDVLDRLHQVIGRKNLVWHEAVRSVERALRWATLLDAGIPLPDGPADPYAPLLTLLERGGPFYTEHHFFDLTSSMIPIPKTSWPDHLATQPLVSLDHADLDQLDREYNRRHNIGTGASNNNG
jgi:hypothetical protein